MKKLRNGLVLLSVVGVTAWAALGGGVFEGATWRLGFNHEREAGDTYRVYTNGVLCSSATNFMVMGTLSDGVTSLVAVDMVGFAGGQVRVEATCVSTNGLESGRSEVFSLTVERDRPPKFLRVGK